MGIPKRKISVSSSLLMLSKSMQYLGQDEKFTFVDFTDFVISQYSPCVADSFIRGGLGVVTRIR